MIELKPKPKSFGSIKGIIDEWMLISDFYGERCANRSQVPLINHIGEGLKILDDINAGNQAKAAFCIHPIIQNDGDLAMNFDGLYKRVSADVLGYAMEYRSVANEYLSFREISNISEVRLSPLKVVNDMLVADKVQNFKDFIIYHGTTHPRRVQLHEYFCNWLKKLECEDVMDNVYPEWRNL